MIEYIKRLIRQNESFSLAVDSLRLMFNNDNNFLKAKRDYHYHRTQAERQILEEALQTEGLLQQNSCPLCGGRLDKQRFSNPVGFRFTRCDSDGVVYMDPIPTESVLSRLYNDPSMALAIPTPLDADSTVSPSNVDDYRFLIHNVEPSNSKRYLLDVGCNSGGFLLTALRNFEVEGIELCRQAASIAQQQGLNVTVGRVQDLPGTPRYDIITMQQVIEHIPDPKVVLLHTRRLLNKGGYCYLSTPNIDSASFDYLGREHTHVSSFGHVSLFGISSLASLVQESGFEVIKQEEYGGLDYYLHDWFTQFLSPKRFRHRFSIYRHKIFHLCNAIDYLTNSLIPRMVLPDSRMSYQRILARKTG